MSTFYEFTILKVEGNKCQIRFELVHPDPDGSDYMPTLESYEFYLAVLIECFELCLDGRMFEVNNPSEENEIYQEHCAQLAKNSLAFNQLNDWADLNHQAIKELAIIFITKINILNAATNVGKEDKELYWWKEVEIEVSASKLLQHLEVGMFWYSASYSY